MVYGFARHACLACLLAVPAWAQVTDNCTGQPLLDGDDFGNFATSADPGGSFTGDMDTSAEGCADVTGPHNDSVFCFRPQTSCIAGFAIGGGVGEVALAITTRQDPCTNTPTGCIRGDTGDGAVALPLVNLNADVLVCVYGAWAGGSPIYGTAGLDGCGALPVELLEFGIDGP